jgi:hypothetical protein
LWATQRKRRKRRKKRVRERKDLREDLRNGLIVACMLTRFGSFEALRLRREGEMLGRNFVATAKA